MITKFKLFEKINNGDLFKNEKYLKELLLKDDDFYEGDVHQALMNVIYNDYNKNNKDYDYQKMLSYGFENFGILPEFAMMLGKYNYQVCNGGHLQYYDNGYAGSHKINIDIHDNFIELFNDLDMINILSTGQLTYDIINDFNLEFSDDIEQCDICGGSGEIDCAECDGNGEVDCSDCDGTGEIDDETCANCNGEGKVTCDECEGESKLDCDECNGKGEVDIELDEPDTHIWDILDKKWYSIDEITMKDFNDYLKTLTLDGEKMTDLIEISNNIKKYNI